MNNNFIPIVKAALSGDNLAFEALYNMTKDSAYFVALNITQNEQDAEDILHNSYIKAFQNLASLNNPEMFDNWFNRIVSNTSKDYIKKKKPILFADTTEFEGEWVEEESNKSYIPHQSADNNETSRLIMDIINKLPEDQRLCILMFYYQDMSVADIAAELDLTPSNVKYKLSRARKAIKAGVEDLEKKGTKLYGVAPLAALPSLLTNAAQISTASHPAPIYASLTAAASASSASAAGVVNTATASTAAKAGFLSTLTGKIAIAAAALVVVAAVTIGVVVSTSKNNPDTPISSYGGNTESSSYSGSEVYGNSDSTSTVGDVSNGDNSAESQNKYYDDFFANLKVELLASAVVDYDADTMEYMFDNNSVLNPVKVDSSVDKATILTIGARLENEPGKDDHSIFAIDNISYLDADGNEIEFSDYKTFFSNNFAGSDYMIVMARIPGEVDPSTVSAKINTWNEDIYHVYNLTSEPVGFDEYIKLAEKNKYEYSVNPDLVKIKGRTYVTLSPHSIRSGSKQIDDNHWMRNQYCTKCLIPLEGGFENTLTTNDVKTVFADGTTPPSGTKFFVTVNDPEYSEKDSIYFEKQITIDLVAGYQYNGNDDLDSDIASAVSDYIENVSAEFDNGDGTTTAIHF